MADISGKGIFFAELDDDFQDLRQLSDQELLSRTVCYFLLAPSVIIHPAYIWQSEIAHRLMHGPAHDLLRPPFAQLELGNYANIRDYMTRRIEKLQRPAQPTRELREYEAHGDRLLEEARVLDARFETAVSRDVSASWRDKRFRDLLSRDLGATDLDSNLTLAAQLGALRVDSTEADKARDLAELMQRFVRSANLVSVDTFRRRIYVEGFRELEASEALRRRLLALYYQTYADEETLIPATSKLLQGQVVNLYDATVFWRVMTRFFGDECLILSTAAGPEVVTAVRNIKESSDWGAFVRMYFETLSTVDEVLWSQPGEIIATFDKGDPGRSQSFILKNLWQRRKAELAGAAFGAVAMASSAFDTPITTAASVAGFAAFAAGGVGLLRNVRRFMESYKTLDLIRVKAAVRSEVDRALINIRRQTGII